MANINQPDEPGSPHSSPRPEARGQSPSGAAQGYCGPECRPSRRDWNASRNAGSEVWDRLAAGVGRAPGSVGHDGSVRDRGGAGARVDSPACEHRRSVRPCCASLNLDARRCRERRSLPWMPGRHPVSGRVRERSWRVRAVGDGDAIGRPVATSTGDRPQAVQPTGSSACRCRPQRDNSCSGRREIEAIGNRIAVSGIVLPKPGYFSTAGMSGRSRNARATAGTLADWRIGSDASHMLLCGQMLELRRRSPRGSVFPWRRGGGACVCRQSVAACRT